MKIQTKVFIITLSVVIIMSILALIITRFVSQSIIEQQISNRLLITAHSRVAHIETFLESGRELVKQLSESIVIEKFLSAGKDDENYIQVVDDVTRRLENTARIAKYTYESFIFDKNGIIVASSEERNIGKDKSNDPYFIGGKKGAFIKDALVS